MKEKNTTQLAKDRVPFTQVANSVLNDPNISWKAKGIYAHLYSKPDGWDFSAHRMSQQCSDGRKATLSGLKELEESGYISREKLPTGRILYTVRIKPESPNGTVPKRHGAKRAPISNKEVIVIKKRQRENTRQFLSELSPETVKEMTDKFKCEAGNVRTYANKILDYCESKGRKYKNYKATLRQWLRRDFGERPVKKDKAYDIVVKDGKAVMVPRK